MMRVSSALAALLALGSATVQGQEARETHRNHGAHVHGIGHMSIAVDEHVLVVEFEAPGADILGFERAPRDEDERMSAAATLALLEDATAFFGPNPEARCELRSMEVVVPFLHGGRDHGAHEHAHGARGHGHGAGAPSTEASTDRRGEPEQLDPHVSGSDVLATYGLECAAPERLRRIDVRLFDHFPSLERIEATFIGLDAQHHRSLRRGSASIDVR